MPRTAAKERGPRALHQRDRVRGFRRDRERARLDAPCIEQVADQAAHVIGLLDDQAVELSHLCRVQRRRLLQKCHCRALDGGQRLAQFVAHQAQELGPQPFDLVKRRQVLNRHHHRAHGVAFGRDRRGIYQRPDAAPVRHRECHLLGPQRLAAAELLREREFAQGHLMPVGAAEGQHLQKLLGRTARHAQALHDSPHLAVERHGTAALRIENHDSHRRGFDQGLEVSACAPLAPEGARVGDRRRGLRGEKLQHLLVPVGEGLAVRLPGKEEVTKIGTPVAHRHAQEGPGNRPRGVYA